MKDACILPHATARIQKSIEYQWLRQVEYLLRMAHLLLSGEVSTFGIRNTEPMHKKEQPPIPYYRSLTLNMTIAIIVVSFIPVFLVGSTIYYNFYASYQEKTYAHLEELVEKHRQQIDDFLVDKLADIRFLSRNLGCTNLSNEAFLQSTLASLQRNYRPVFVDLGVVNGAGQQVAYAGPFKLTEAVYADTDWFQQAMNKEYVISDVFLGLRRLPHFIIASC